MKGQSISCVLTVPEDAMMALTPGVNSWQGMQVYVIITVLSAKYSELGHILTQLKRTTDAGV